MISGKSMVLIRAACSVTGASAAASLGQETRPLSIKTTIPQRLRPLAITSGETPLPMSPTASSTAVISTSTDNWNGFNAPTLAATNDADRMDTFNNALHSIPGGASVDERVGRCGCGEDAAESTVATLQDVRLGSVRYWAQLIKNFNGMYASGCGGGGVGGSDVVENAAIADGSTMCRSGCCGDTDDFLNESNFDSTHPICRLCRSIPHRIPSPTSFKNTTLNTVTASRHLFLVRHGQYHNNRKLERDRRLTRIGREQLKHTGNRLREIGVSYSKIVASTMKRAQESADIILKCIGSSSDLTMNSDSLLEEGAPIVPEPPLPNWKPNQKQYQTDGERIETAFRKYFRKADTSLANDVNEIVVCHANVIRYFVCRALDVQPEAWLRMWLNHGSITWLTIKPSGRVVLNAMGASGYMPPSRLTAT